MEALPPVKGAVPKSARVALGHLMPEPGLSYSLRRRDSGLGSLGRLRFLALADWQGGKIAREAKALVPPSACAWGGKTHGLSTILYQSMLDHAIRCRDPFVRIEGSWLVRRLSPYCSRIELTKLPRKREEDKLLKAMGRETANVHLGSPGTINALQRDLARRKAKWLLGAAKAMTRATLTDWKEWARG